MFAPRGAPPICVLVGTQRERVTFSMRFMAIRYAKLRHLDVGEITLVETDTAGMVADGCTKPLEERAFERFRDCVLGRPEPLRSARAPTVKLVPLPPRSYSLTGVHPWLRSPKCACVGKRPQLGQRW